MTIDFTVPTWLLIHYHFIGTVSFCLNSLTIFLVVFKSDTFDNFRYFLLVFQISCTITDFYMNFLMQPLPLYPVFGGFCTGLLATYFDVWAHYLMVYIITLVICQMEALTFCFLRKHQSIGSILNYHVFPRWLYNSMIIRAFLLPTVFYFVFWKAGIKRDELMDYVKVNYPEYIQGFSTIQNFALYTFDFWTKLVLGLSVLIAGFTGIIFTFTTIDMLKMLESVQRKVSSANYNRHKNAVRSLMAQFATSSLCLVPPLFLVVIILGKFERAQVMVQILLAIFSLHSTVNAFVLIFSTKPYREFLFRTPKKRVHNIAVSTTRNSFQ